MGLMQEGLRRSGEIRNVLAPLNPTSSEIKINSLPTAEAGLEVQIGEISRLLSIEQKEGKETEELQSQETSKNGFEPFIKPSSEDNLFVNGYNGNFAQKMELNRKGVERVLKIAHLDGQVFLTSFAPNRQKSIEANSDGSVSAKRNLFLLEKIEEDDKENPLHRVVPTPEGWRIEINDTRITEELTGKKLGGEQLQRAFINRFNSQLKSALKECVWREKCTSVKDEKFESKLTATLLGGIGTVLSSIGVAFNPGAFTYSALSLNAGVTLWTFYIYNNFPDGRKRPINHPLENFMPPVEIDKIARAWTFLSLKARKLVREAV